MPRHNLAKVGDAFAIFWATVIITKGWSHLMPNFLQQKIEQLKQHRQALKQKKLPRRDGAIIVSSLLTLITLYGISDFNPGEITYMQNEKNEKKVSIAEFSKLAGPQQSITMKDKNPLKWTVQKPATTQKKTTTTTTPSWPTNLPSLPSSVSKPSATPKTSPALERAQATYARHTEISEKIASLLNSSFVMTKMSKAPVGNESRFTSTFEYANAEGTVLEKLELMSIIRTDSLDNIKTAQQAMDALVEESKAINVIESTDEYLIYDFAGDGGYQIGKIAVDDKGIYIFGYVNLTTSELPEILKTEWINHYRNDL